MVNLELKLKELQSKKEVALEEVNKKDREVYTFERGYLMGQVNMIIDLRALLRDRK